MRSSTAAESRLLDRAPSGDGDRQHRRQAGADPAFGRAPGGQHRRQDRRQTVEVQRLVEKLVVSIVDRVEERPVEVQRLVEKLIVDIQDNVVSKPVVVQRLIEQPVVNIVDKVVEVPVEKIVYKTIERSRSSASSK